MTDLSITIPGKFTRTSLELDSRLTYDDWRSVGLNLAQLRDWNNFAIGDWLEYGEVHFGEQYSQAASDTGISEDKLMILKHVSSRVSACYRNKSLSWSHHLEVAKLRPDEQELWLRLSEESRWTVRDLREQLIIAGLREQRGKTSAVVSYLCECCTNSGAEAVYLCPKCVNQLHEAVNL